MLLVASFGRCFDSVLTQLIVLLQKDRLGKAEQHPLYREDCKEKHRMPDCTVGSTVVVCPSPHALTRCGPGQRGRGGGRKGARGHIFSFSLSLSLSIYI